MAYNLSYFYLQVFKIDQSIIELFDLLFGGRRRVFHAVRKQRIRFLLFFFFLLNTNLSDPHQNNSDKAKLRLIIGNKSYTPILDR
jgi:hypothetical protein